MVCLVRTKQAYLVNIAAMILNANDLKDPLLEAGFGAVEAQATARRGHAVPDFVLRADLDGREVVLLVQVKERPHLVDLRVAAERIRAHAKGSEIPVIAARFLGPNRRALLREMGVGYLDLAGNIHLRGAGILVDREQNKNPFGYDSEASNPFSDKASIVLRLLLGEPGRFWKVREMAKAGAINPGWVSRVVEALAKRGLVSFDRSKGISLLRGEEAVREWADLYDWRRNRFNKYYCHAYGVREVMERVSRVDLGDDRSVAFGFQAGASLVAPYASFNQVHVIVDGRLFEAVVPEIVRQLGLEPADNGANLVLVRPHCRSSALFGAEKVGSYRVVSDVQLYLDLHRYPLRGEEQAAHILDKLIRPRLAIDRTGV